VKPVLGDELDAAAFKKIKGTISRYKTVAINKCFRMVPPKWFCKLRMSFLKKRSMAMKNNMPAFYRDYQKSLAEANAMDFDDLLGNTVDLLQRLPQVALQFANRFQYVVVDEYQDTNDVQYELLKFLSTIPIMSPWWVMMIRVFMVGAVRTLILFAIFTAISVR
jgi:DNA helicase-2/ATP-dependent DNA helicase PcrA